MLLLSVNLLVISAVQVKKKTQAFVLYKSIGMQILGMEMYVRQGTSLQAHGIPSEVSDFDGK